MKKINIIKIGGNIIDSETNLSTFLELFSELDGLKVLVHGGGKEATRQAEKLGIPVRTVDGRRQTDEETLKIVVQVYAGLINKNIVAKLQALNCNALGMTGADLNSIPARKRQHPSIDFGFVGDFDTENINTAKLIPLMELGIVPVFCALTHDSEGNLLNTNADTIASGLAIALSEKFETELFYGFEKKGVLNDPEDDTSVIQDLDLKKYEELKNSHAIHDGMIPKLDNAFNALESGVKKVTIGHALEINESNGTELHLHHGRD